MVANPAVKISDHRITTFFDSYVSRNSWWMLLLLVLIGTGLRLYNLTYQSLWYDELHSMIPTDPKNTILSVIEYAKTDQPPLFFVYLHTFFKFFGYSEFNGRLASAIVGILGIPAMYLLGRAAKNEETGLAAALFTTVNYYHIYYSQDVRFYGLSFLLSCLSFLFFIRATKSERWQDYFFYFICTTLLLYTHYYGIIIFISQAIILLIVSVRKKKARFLFVSLAVGLGVAICYIPWLPTVLQDSKIQSFWIEKPTLLFIVHYLLEYMGRDYISCILFLILGVSFIRNWLFLGKKTELEYLVVVLWILLSYGIPFIWSLIDTPLLYIRYTMVTLPAWLILLAIGYQGIQQRNLKYAAIVVIFISSILNLTLRINYYSRTEKAQYREVSALVQKANTNNLPVYSSSSWHWNFYFQNIGYRVQQLNPDTLPTRFWLVQSHSHQEMTKEVNELMRQFSILERHDLHQANALLFSKR